eukprot:CAMPEP_0119427380 /NCGR_PEP_ID=MMETSP1335-20130426/38175_1 /TAXON_ID=259385 /ORGANISM="Chrysoculter rhomboideus, Strain RCC1486" /LENGTH=184 /DNA_ID=CAMNT_0007453009 /DNA_START=84 /DNA_END=639 /DNA_ORIENTATION=-
MRISMRLGDQVDFELVKCDASLLTIYALGKATVQITTQGHFDPTPMMTVQDLVDISHSFNDAASASLGWLIAGALVKGANIFRTPLERDSRAVVQSVCAVFAFGGPLGLGLKALALSPSGAYDPQQVLLAGLTDLPVELLLLVLWRVLIAPGMMLRVYDIDGDMRDLRWCSAVFPADADNQLGR